MASVPFPAFCPHCGLVFQSRALGFFGNAEVMLRGNRETCPRCNQLAELPDGTFSVTDDTITVLSASRLTRERLQVVADILAQAQAEEITPEEASEAVAQEAPSLAPLLTRYGPQMRKALIVFLLFVIETIIQQGVSELRDNSATKQDVQQAVQQSVQRCLDWNGPH